MTELPAPRGPMFDPLLTRPVVRPTPERRAHRRRHPAQGARIVAAGLGISTMFGLVATMGIAQATASTATSAPVLVATPTPPPPPPPSAVTAPTSLPTPAPTSTPDPVTTVAPTPAPSTGPIVLTARPQVRVVQPAPTAQAAPPPAPAATTSGSS